MGVFYPGLHCETQLSATLNPEYEGEQERE